jgi:DNA-binding NarL/FixJ family response regulator
MNIVLHTNLNAMKKETPLPKRKVAILNRQEACIATLTAREMSVQQIAGMMGLSEQTVEHIRAAIMQKLQCTSTIGISLYAWERNWVAFGDTSHS